MKIKHLKVISVMSACLLAPVLVQAGSYEDAVSEANAAINNAKAVNYEWRDSRKLLKKADTLNKQGQTDKALKLVKKAEKQGKLAVAQARLYSNVNGPHQ